jgi:hypothetical protein
MRTKHREFFLLVPGFFLLLFLFQNCASTTGKESERTPAQLFQKPYDEVWNAVEDFVENDLMCVSKKKNKKKGHIETEWVHRIDTEGTLRWRIVADMEKKANGVLVLINKKIELRDDVSKQVNRYKKESKDTAMKNSGWTRKQAERSTIESFYHKIDNKLLSAENN